MAGKESGFEPASGWEDEVAEDHQNIESKLIDIANSKISLDSVFQRYNIPLEPSYSTTGWAFRCSCPFKDHNDRTPSFGYNPRAGIFNCFGCHRGGKAVEFMAHMDGRARIDIARQIVGQYSTEEVLLHNSDFDFEKLQGHLFDFADTIRAFRLKHSSPSAVKYSKAVSWNLDVYLRKHAPFNTIVLEHLGARISKLEAQLELYGD